MASLNKAILIGNLGRDPEGKAMPNGDPITTFSIATSESWKDKNTGEKVEKVEWHNVVMYRRLAEIAAQYLKKGSKVYIEGRIQTRKYTNKEGAERHITEIVADEMKMLGTKSDPAPGNAADSPQSPEPARNTRAKAAEYAQASAGGLDGDIPF